MIETAKEALNVSHVLKEISTFCYSESSRDLILNSEFYTNADFIKSQRAILNDYILYYNKDLSLEIGYYENINAYIEAIRPEFATISSEFILKIAHVIEITNRLSKFSESLSDHPQMKKQLSYFDNLSDLFRKINKIISDSGEIKDNASSKLSSIRRSLRFLDSQIRSKTLELAKSKYKDYLIDSETTIRDGVTVLSVKSEHTALVNGTVHGYSNTGSTVFIGPEENSKKLREMNQLQSDELREIDKILQELCAEIRNHSAEILSNYKLLLEIDSFNAKAQYARRHDCILPKINTKDYLLMIKEAYHPVLLQTITKSEIVPLDIEFGKDHTVVIISGPNAGGKTVALKTVGLYCLLNQMIIPLPCHEETYLPIFHQIFCDIGDHQSIDNDLSTFSSHIQNIKKFLDRSSIDTLILLDELGTGTDPKEGSALSQSFIYQFLKNGSKVIATTHIGELKIFASETDGVQNASISFNEEELTSTFKLLQNIPGQSYAFSIAERFGIQKKVIKDAKKKLSESDINIEKLIKELHFEISSNESLKKELDLKVSKAKTVETMYESKLRKIKKYEKEIKDSAIKQADELLHDVNKKIEKTIYDIRKSNAETKQIKKSKDIVHELKGKVSDLKKNLKAKSLEHREGVEFSIGDRVRHIQFQTIGEIIEINSNKYRLQLGNLTMHVDKDEIDFISSAKKEFKAQNMHVSHEISTTVKNEIDVRGKYFEEAWDMCDEFIEMALSTGWEEISIIHGKGAGILSQRINEQLKHDKRIKTKRFGKHGEGDTGVTILKLRY